MIRPRVVVLGGGFAGLETLFYLRHVLGEDVDLALVSDREHFLFLPDLVYVPVGRSPAALRVPLVRLARRLDFELVTGRAVEVSPFARTVRLADRRALFGDFLVVATGAATQPGAIPGLREHGHGLASHEEALALRQALARLVGDARRREAKRLLFAVPPGAAFAGPLYELALLADLWLRRRGVREAVELAWLTAERRYLEAYGPRLDAVVSEAFAAHGIVAAREVELASVEPGRARLAGGEVHPFDLLVGLPGCAAAQPFDSLPLGEGGFVEVDAASRLVAGHEGVFAVGDAAQAATRRIPLALLQADAAAAHVVAAVRGGEPSVRYERFGAARMAALDEDVFAKVPLTAAPDPLRPVAEDEARAGRYRIGVAPLWRLGRDGLGHYLPWRLGLGRPFHQGLAWEAAAAGGASRSSPPS